MDLLSVILALAATLGVTKLFLVVKTWVKTWITFRKFPGPSDPPYPLLGHSLLFNRSLDENYKMVGKIVKEDLIEHGHEVGVVWMGMTPVVAVAGQNTAEVLLRSSEHIQKSFSYDFLHPWLGTGLLTASGDKWKARRKLLTPTFHFSILQDFLEVMNEQASIFTSKLEKSAESEEIFNICNPVTLCALDIICETAMGKSVYAQDNKDSEYVKAIYKSSEVIQKRQNSPWLWPDFIFSRTKKGKLFAGYMNILHSFTKSVIEDRMKVFNSNLSPTEKKRLAFLDLLLSVSDGGKVLSESDIQEEVDTFMFEGHDTTAAAMAWAIFLIGSHPDVQCRIQDELDEILGDDTKKSISMEDVRKMEYMEMVIKESLRLLPSVPMIGRTTSCDCVLDGHHVPVGSECVIFVHFINTNKNFWNDADKFDPERFTPENSTGRHPYTYLPFSAGPRNCIGQRFALMEEKVILAHFLRKFSVESCDVLEDMKINSDLILRAQDGIHVKMKKRH